MEKVRFGIIGVGNMGYSHSKKMLEGKVENGVLAAVCDLKQDKLDRVKELEGSENDEKLSFAIRMAGGSIGKLKILLNEDAFAFSA